MEKAPDAFRTISEVSEWLDTPAHVLRFWESRFPEVAPVKRAGGRRYYRVEDMQLLGGIKKLLHDDGATIKAVQDRLKSEGPSGIASLSPPVTPAAENAAADMDEAVEDAADPAATASDPTPAPAPPPAPPPAGAMADTPRGEAAGTTAPVESEVAGIPQVSFVRHPKRKAPEAPEPQAEAPRPANRPHPTRPGLFVYDDSAMEKPAAAPTAKPALLPIDDLPADPDDTCAPQLPIPVAADFRALAALSANGLPSGARAPIDKLKALRDRLA